MADAEAIIGAKVEVFNPDENLWATGRIERYYPDKGWLMQYYDGDSAWVPSLENVQIMQRVDGSDDEEGDEVDGQNHEEYNDAGQFEDALSPMKTTDQDALRELIDGGEDSDMNEFDEYLLSHPHGDETLRELAGLERKPSAQPSDNADEDEDLEHMPAEENNAVIEIKISEITDLVTPASDIQNPQVRILFADTPTEQQQRGAPVDWTFRCKSLLFTSGVGVTADTNALEWKDGASNNCFTFEAIMQDGPIEEALFGDLILALHGDTPVGHQQMVAEACIHLKDVLRNGESRVGELLAKISINTAAPMKQRLNRKTMDGVIHFAIDIYFRRARLMMMQHQAPALDAPRPPMPRNTTTTNGATRKRRSTRTSTATKKRPPPQKTDHAALRRNSAIARREREQVALKQQNERHLAKLNNTRSHVAKLLGKDSKPPSNSRRLIRTGAPPPRPSSKPVVLDDSVKAVFHDPTALAACIVELRKSIAELEESNRQSRVKLQKQEMLLTRRKKQIAQASAQPLAPATATAATSIGGANTFSQLDLGALAPDDLELQELRATNDAFTATKRQLTEQIEMQQRRYETTSQAYDQRVSQLRIAKRRIKRMMESKRRREENEFDVDSGSDEDSKFLRLHQQHITLQAEIEALSQFREVTDRGPDHELDPMRATVAKLQQQVEAARERLEAAQQTLQMYKAKNEEYNTSQLYEKWRKCVAAMRAITTKCDREERLHAVAKQIEDVDPGYRRTTGWRT